MSISQYNTCGSQCQHPNFPYDSLPRQNLHTGNTLLASCLPPSSSWTTWPISSQSSSPQYAHLYPFLARITSQSITLILPGSIDSSLALAFHFLTILSGST